jgi:hypothetical protein
MLGYWLVTKDFIACSYYVTYFLPRNLIYFNLTPTYRYTLNIHTAAFSKYVGLRGTSTPKVIKKKITLTNVVLKRVP